MQIKKYNEYLNSLKENIINYVELLRQITYAIDQQLAKNGIDLIEKFSKFHSQEEVIIEEKMTVYMKEQIDKSS